MKRPRVLKVEWLEQQVAQRQIESGSAEDK